MSGPRVSVLLPCRDAATTLDAAIASIESQTFDAFEVIAVNDGSSDDGGARLDAWAARDRRVRVLHTPPLGLVSALESARGVASAPLIARMDADDIAHPERLAAQVRLLDESPDIAACGARIRYFPRRLVRAGARRYERWINALTEPEDIARDIWIECPIPHPTLLIRRSTLDAVGGWQDHGCPEDYDLVLRLHAAGQRMAKVARVLLQWREGPTRLSRSDPRYSEAAFCRLKVEHLTTSLLRGRDGVVVWGAGPVGKRFALECIAQEVPLRAFVDVDPRKIGQAIHGAPVVSATDLNRFREAFVVAAVSGPGPRREIRAALLAAGRIELMDFCAVA